MLNQDQRSRRLRRFLLAGKIAYSCSTYQTVNYTDSSGLPLVFEICLMYNSSVFPDFRVFKMVLTWLPEKVSPYV